MEMDIKTAITNVLISTGRICMKDRIEIIEKDAGSSDYAKVGVHVYHGRKRSPYVYWNICIDMARNIIRWDKSEFQYI